MNTKTLAATTMAVAALTTSTFAGGTDFFWSLQNLGNGAVNDDVTANLNPGDTATLYLYYSTNGPADSDLSIGAGLNVSTSTSGVIRFTAAETFDFDITIVGTPIGRRWLDSLGGGGAARAAHAVTDDVVTGLTAFTITGGPGILESNNGNPFLDEGYDSGADAFLYGSVTFEVIGGGSVDINAAANVLGIVNGDTTVNATFGGATINAGPAPCDAYVLENIPGQSLRRFPVDDPTNQTTIATGTPQSLALEFNSSATVLYAVDLATGELGTFDTTTGVFTPHATLTGLIVDDTLTGLSMDPTSETMFLSASDGSSSTLYTLDVATGVATPIGGVDGPIHIDIAIDCGGQMYAHDIISDSLFEIDKWTGTCTLIGPTGFDANFAQGLDFDYETGTLYGTLYPADQSATFFVSFDLDTGAATTVGTFDGEFELAIACTCPTDCNYVEDFDAYDDDSVLVGQGGWIPWLGDPNFEDARVTSTEARTFPHSVAIDDDDDVVQEISGVNSGQWTVEAWQFVPATMTGEQFFILLNRYEPTTDDSWSVQVIADGSQNVVRDNVTAVTLPLVRDRWVQYRVDIDFDTDSQTVYYDGGELYSSSWTSHTLPGGDLNLAAIDLFNNAGTVVYWDDIRVCPTNTCPADLDGNGAVNFQDLLVVLGDWGPYSPCPPYKTADVNRDCNVAFSDIVALLGSWGLCP